MFKHEIRLLRMKEKSTVCTEICSFKISRPQTLLNSSTFIHLKRLYQIHAKVDCVVSKSLKVVSSQCFHWGLLQQWTRLGLNLTGSLGVYGIPTHLPFFLTKVVLNLDNGKFSEFREFMIYLINHSSMNPVNLLILYVTRVLWQHPGHRF